MPESASRYHRLSASLDRLRRPEYTGENRCLPCTLVNLGITAGLTAGTALVSPPAALGVAGVSLAAIYLRGYLVPGTPALTKRYLPDRVLRWFDHDALPRRPGLPDEDFDVAAVLLDAGVVVDDGVDVTVDPAFEQRWFDRVADIDVRLEAEAADALAELMEIPRDHLELVSHATGFTAYVDDFWAGQWESRAALLADLAAARELETEPVWNALSLVQRSEVLGGLRAVLSRCPVCSGSVSLESSIVESCCRTVDVIAATCEDCDARLFELEYDPDKLAADPEVV